MSPPGASLRAASLGLAEVRSWSVSFVLADGACRRTSARLLGMEATGGETVLSKFGGGQAEVEAALAWYGEAAPRLGVEAAVTLLARPEPELNAVLSPPNAVHPLYGHREQFLPSDHPAGALMNPSQNPSHQAIGILETVGLAAALEAADVMLKTASVTLVGKEKIGAAYVTIVVRGDVAAVQAALAAARGAVGALGKLVAAHLIARPHADMLALLPR